MAKILHRARRLLFLALALLGAGLWAAERPANIGVAPLPGPNLKVRFGVEVRFGGDYVIEVSMPKAGGGVALGTLDVVQCDLSLEMVKAGIRAYSQRIDKLNGGNETGWAYTRQYVSGPSFHLNRGTYEATISANSGCPAAVTRGASVTLAREYKEHILGSLFLELFTWTLILVGVMGLYLT